MSETIRFPVFVDQDGNRFIFPSVYHETEDGRGLSATQMWAYCLQLQVALKVDKEKETFDVKVEDGHLNFPHVVADAGSRGFKHGGAKVWLISGPKFDEIAKEEASNDQRTS
jgi:hypothetical protein